MKKAGTKVDKMAEVRVWTMAVMRVESWAASMVALSVVKKADTKGVKMVEKKVAQRVSSMVALKAVTWEVQ